MRRSCRKYASTVCSSSRQAAACCSPSISSTAAGGDASDANTSRSASADDIESTPMNVATQPSPRRRDEAAAGLAPKERLLAGADIHGLQTAGIDQVFQVECDGGAG